MKSRFIFTTLFFLAFIYVKGQKSIPGYLGSRNLLSVKVMPNMYVAAHNGSEVFSQFLSPNIGITYERVRSRKTSISITAGIAPGAMNATELNGFKRNNYLEVYYSNQLSQVKNYEGFLKYNNNFFSISKSFYRLKSASIAPQGKFLKMGFTFNMFKIKVDSIQYRLTSGEVFNNNGKSYNTLTMGSFNMEFGSKRFVSKHIFLQKAMAFNLPFNFWTTSSSKTFQNVEDFNETNLVFYLSKLQTFNLSLSLGYAF